MKIRRLEPEDAATAAGAVKLFASEEVSLGYMERFLSDPTTYLIVAELDGEIAGFVLTYALRRMKQDDSVKMFIYEIEVAPKHRRKGVGTALINYVRDIVRKEKMYSAFVFTNYSNEGAVEFYKSTGAAIENGDDLLFYYEG
jgi:ribosomal protein S18 acetylase RimI-like enzyme